MKFLAIPLLMALAAACEKDEKPCIDESKITQNPCTKEYNPVCGCDGKTYGNQCEALNAGLTSIEEGPCQ